MDRKEFVFYLINKVFRPFVYLVLLVSGIYFLAKAVNNSEGIERTFIYGGLFVIAVLFVFGLLLFVFDSAWAKVSDGIKKPMKKANTILQYALIPVGLYYCYINWENHKWTMIGLATFYLFIFFYKKLIVKHEAESE